MEDLTYKQAAEVKTPTTLDAQTEQSPRQEYAEENQTSAKLAHTAMASALS